MLKLDSVVFEMLRPLLICGVPIRDVLKELDAQKNESVLDAGCGFGFLADPLSHCYYTGVDIDAGRISTAKSRYAENDRRRFVTADICNTGFPSKSFDQSVAYGLIHHLPDDQALRCIQEMLRMTRKNVVFFDTVFTKYHLPNNLLSRFDQGKFVRHGDKYVEFARKAGADVSYRYVNANNFIMTFFMMTCKKQGS